MERTKVCVRAPNIKHFLIKQPSSKNHSLWSQTFWWEEIFWPNIELWFFLIDIQVSTKIYPRKRFIFLQSNVIIPRRGCRYFGTVQHQAVLYLGEPSKRPTLPADFFGGQITSFFVNVRLYKRMSKVQSLTGVVHIRTITQKIFLRVLLVCSQSSVSKKLFVFSRMDIHYAHCYCFVQYVFKFLSFLPHNFFLFAKSWSLLSHLRGEIFWEHGSASTSL